MYYKIEKDLSGKMLRNKLNLIITAVNQAKPGSFDSYGWMIMM